MGLRHLGDISFGDASISIFWKYSQDLNDLRGVEIIGREKLSVGVGSGEKDIVERIAKKFFSGKEDLVKGLEGKKVIIFFSEKISSASLAEVGREKRGLPYKSIEAVIGVEKEV